MFNYAENGINYAGGAIAGYNVGDSNRHFKLRGSLSEDIRYIDNTKGNTGRRGQWVLLLDGELPNSQMNSCRHMFLHLNQRVR